MSPEQALTPEIQGREVSRLGSAPPPSLFLQEAGLEKRFWEFFTAQIPNPNTRRAYYNAISQFSAWCLRHGLPDLYPNIR